MLSGMAVWISMLRGVNLGPHNRMKMDDLRAVYESLGLKDVRTYVQSGNVIFRGPALSPKRIEDAIEKRFGFRPPVILRTPDALRDVIARNPFPGREPAKLLVWFLASDPGEDARRKLRDLPAVPEELHADGAELFIYYTNGMARPKLSMAVVERMLKIAGTGRNWNTVTKLLELAGASFNSPSAVDIQSP